MTPLDTALRQFADQNPLRMCMPGHKGKLPGTELDFTELTPTGNLYQGGEPFETAQALWAERFGFAGCQFLTGGSTQGVHTALALCCKPGERVLLDRGCHKSAFDALALLDVEPEWMWDFDEHFQDYCGNFKTVCITSPDYYGNIRDIPAIAQKVHPHGGRLIVDGAHGAHLPFLGVDAFSGADLVVCSAHKTLPALGQSALLFYQDFPPEEVRRRAAMYGSSSPSYLLTSSMDRARAWMEEEGTGEYQRVAKWAARCRTRFPSLRTGMLDPMRLTLTAPDGNRAAALLEQENIFIEMSDSGHLVLILSGMDTGEELYRLEKLLEKLPLGDPPALPPRPRPDRVLSQREALFAPVEYLPLDQCQDRIAAQPLAPYPPGIPIVAPGERISQKELAYFAKIGYNKEQTGVVIE